MKAAARNIAFLAGLLAFAGAACAGGAPAGTGSQSGTGQIVTQPEIPLGCSPQPGTEPLAERASPFDSVRVTIGTRAAQVCYSRPSAKGRAIFGGLLPYGKLWRTGANEPTIIHISFPAEIAGIRVEPGSYSIYTIPTEKEWTVIVNRSISQWGHESLYKPNIQAQEVARAQVPSEHLDDMVETFAIRAEPRGTDTVDLVLEWERTRVRIPIHAIGA
jgi:hypothetical protein